MNRRLCRLCAFSFQEDCLFLLFLTVCQYSEAVKRRVEIKAGGNKGVTVEQCSQGASASKVYHSLYSKTPVLLILLMFLNAAKCFC